jgi:hypothetical protein
VTVIPATSVADLLALFDRYDFNAFPIRQRVSDIVSAGEAGGVEVVR